MLKGRRPTRDHFWMAATAAAFLAGVAFGQWQVLSSQEEMAGLVSWSQSLERR